MFIKIYINRATPSVKSTTKIYIFTDTVNHTLLSSLVYKGILSHFSVVVLIHLIGMNSAPEVGNHCSENRNCNVDSGIRNHFTPEKKPLKESKTLHQEKSTVIVYFPRNYHVKITLYLNLIKALQRAVC